MAATTTPGTVREPRIALGVALERTRPGRASIADVAAALNVLTALIGDQVDEPMIDMPDADTGMIWTLAVAEYQGAPVIISGGSRRLRSWRLDDGLGELNVTIDTIHALAVVEHEGPLIISAGVDRALRSWRLDGRPGELQIPDAHSARILALAVVEHEGPLIISAGDGRCAAGAWTAVPDQIAVRMNVADNLVTTQLGGLVALGLVEKGSAAPHVLYARRPSVIWDFAPRFHAEFVERALAAALDTGQSEASDTVVVDVDDDEQPRILGHEATRSSRVQLLDRGAPRSSAALVRAAADGDARAWTALGRRAEKVGCRLAGRGPSSLGAAAQALWRDPVAVAVQRGGKRVGARGNSERTAGRGPRTASRGRAR